MIKIDTQRPTQKIAPKNNTRSKSSSGSGFAATVSAAENTQETNAPAAMNPAQSLLGLQEVDERTQAKKRGQEMLSYLDEIRIELLTGEVDNASLKNMAARMKGARQSYQDPGVAQVIEEIEQRVNIELAKRGLL